MFVHFRFTVVFHQERIQKGSINNSIVSKILDNVHFLCSSAYCLKSSVQCPDSIA